MSTEKSMQLRKYFEIHHEDISHVVQFDRVSDKLFHFNFTSTNTQLNPVILGDTKVFSEWVSQTLLKENSRYGVGGYDEHRTIYSRSGLFDKDEEPRRLHLGIDIWGPEGTLVFAPIVGRIHSYRFNDNFGDYGATIVLEHEVEGLRFHTLYGHLNLASITNLEKGFSISKGEKIAELGNVLENGHWPPHLHFQIIFDMQGMDGDYPGVCRFSEKDAYLSNCPDPEILLKHTFRY
jgi:murein DD-endopeptidase MepM/ murein hydrolase activator NlpD